MKTVIKIPGDEIKGGVLKNINYKDPLVRYRGQKVYRLAKIIADDKPIPLDINAVIDVFYTFYLPYPILREDVGRDKFVAYQLIKSMLNSEHIHDIRCRTVADSLMSSIAASIFISELEREMRRQIARSMFREGVTRRDLLRGEVPLDRVVEKAMETTKKDVSEARKLRLLIEGQQPGSVSMISFDEYVPEIIKLARNVEVKKILDIIAGVKPWSINIPRKKYRSKHGEITGYELGKDIERIVPSNLALPDELFYLRFLEGKLLLHQKVLTQSHGPLYVLLDKCLPQHTMVLMENLDERPIDELKPGDRLVSISFGKGISRSLARVVKIYDNGVREIYRIKTVRGYLEATGNHRIPVYTWNYGLRIKRVNEIVHGDYLLRIDHDHIYFERVIGVEETCYRERVYDIVIDRHHFFLADGYVVHNSGSMDGIKITWAKAVALSLYLRALKEHREFYFRFFDSVPYPLAKIGKKPNIKQTLKLIEYIAMVRGSGGTDISRALLLACNDIRSGVTKGVSDIILITDGVDRIAEQLVNYNLKKANARLISVMIFGDNKSLRRISTKYFTVKKLDDREILKIIEA